MRCPQYCGVPAGDKDNALRWSQNTSNAVLEEFDKTQEENDKVKIKKAATEDWYSIMEG